MEALGGTTPPEVHKVHTVRQQQKRAGGKHSILIVKCIYRGRHYEWVKKKCPELDSIAGNVESWIMLAVCTSTEEGRRKIVQEGNCTSDSSDDSLVESEDILCSAYRDRRTRDNRSPIHATILIGKHPVQCDSWGWIWLSHPHYNQQIQSNNVQCSL